jgi:ammonium transporter Rh
MGSASSLRLSPGGALAVGIFAGVMSTMGFARLMPTLESKIGLGDTCGVHNLHGMPGELTVHTSYQFVLVQHWGFVSGKAES